MIQYTLKCDQGHQTESWFQSAAAYDALEKAGHLSCGICGSTSVSKALMSPRVQATAAEKPATTPMLKDPSGEVEKALAALRQKVESTSDYVGTNFAKEARDMHDGLVQERAIYGEANLQEAKALVDDGIPVVPLPFMPSKKTN